MATRSGGWDCQPLEAVCAGAAKLIEDILGRFPYERYADGVYRVLVRNLGDDALLEALARVEPGAVLFTGGSPSNASSPRKLATMQHPVFQLPVLAGQTRAFSLATSLSARRVGSGRR